MCLSDLAWIAKKEGGKERFKSGVKGNSSVADTGLAPDCIYSSTKRFTFTKSFQLHGAHRISTLLSSFGDVILLAAMAEEMQATTTKLLSFSFDFSLFLSLSLSRVFLSPSVFRGERLQSRSGESFRKSSEEAYRGPFVHRHLDFTSCANPTATRLCLSFCLSLSIMGFRRSLANYRNPVYRVNSFLWYYGLIIMQPISRYCAHAVCYPLLSFARLGTDFTP